MHGTAVASLIGAKADAVGMRGVAYESKMYSYGILGNDSTMNTPERIKQMFNTFKYVIQRPERATIAVYNCSFGAGAVTGYSLFSDEVSRAIDDVTTNGFNGKGSGLVFAAGNDAMMGTASNNPFLNHPRVLGVNAINRFGHFPGLGNTRGENIWLTAPSGMSQLVADNVGSCGRNDTNYYDSFGATSGAAPLVSGVVALLRQVRPELTWRDIKLILAESAKKIISLSVSGRYARRTTGRMYHDATKKQEYTLHSGFGLIDAKAALDLTRIWTPLPTEKVVHKTVTFNKNATNDVRHHFDIDFKNTNINFIESIVLDITYDADEAVKLQYFTLGITAPDGKKSHFYDNLTDWTEMKMARENYGHIKLLSNAFLGSRGVNGIWRVHFEQSSNPINKTIKKIKTVKITVRGH